MQINVALRGRTRLAALPQHLEQEAGQRERGKCGRQMEHIGRVRRAKSTPKKKRSKAAAQKRKRKRKRKGSRPVHQEERRTATAPGSVDIWAGLVLRGKRFLPLARQLFS